MSVVEEVATSVNEQGQTFVGQSTSAGESATSAPSHSGVVRRRLPDERRAITHHFSIAGQEGYLTIGVYEDGSPGEIFVRMTKEGSTVSGLMDGFAKVMSLALQHGVPLKVLCGKLSHMRFEPSGWTGNPKIGFAKSILDYIARWLEIQFLEGEQRELFAPLSEATETPLPRSTQENAGHRSPSSFNSVTLLLATAVEGSWCAAVPAIGVRTAVVQVGARRLLVF